ncbi:alpha/beta hydrolase family protein [Micromonospora humidisoli]|uniref:Alpha/beta hydrolase family protein n=1 Tax=Micromonospora humidisoli TaxID=2807622 RepID=A0ABS2JGC8_9ACTN|nr:hypothetical protein [Micromonospora humidisoli]MBM7085575.1 hypothetical protein [Micromonospora humidisoli]
MQRTRYRLGLAAVTAVVVTGAGGRIGVGNDELAAVVATPTIGSPQRMVMMLHGGPGGQKDGPADLYVDLAERLGAAGIASVRFDFRGCG